MIDQPKDIILATRQLFERYREMLYASVGGNPANNKYPIDKIECDNIKWMIETALENIDFWPIDKLNRWLGFIQYFVCLKEYTTVDDERDFSRPLFHDAYSRSGISIPSIKEKDI